MLCSEIRITSTPFGHSPITKGTIATPRPDGPSCLRFVARLASALLVLGALATASGGAKAGTITAFAGVGPDGNMITIPTGPDGGSVTVRGGEVSVSRTTDSMGNFTGYTINKSFTSFDPIDIVITVTDSTPPGTAVTHFAENLRNDGRAAWFDYHFVLGYGVGTPFTPVGPGAPVFPRFPTPTVDGFDLNSQLGNGLVFLGGSLAPLSDTRSTFDLETPNSTAIPPEDQIFENGQPVGYRFTLREQPSPIPAPVSVVLLGTGLGGLLGCLGWRRRGRLTDDFHVS